MRNPTKKRISSSSSCSEQSVDLSDDPDTRYNLIKLMRTNKAVLLTVGTALRCTNSVSCFIYKTNVFGFVVISDYFMKGIAFLHTR